MKLPVIIAAVILLIGGALVTRSYLEHAALKTKLPPAVEIERNEAQEIFEKYPNAVWVLGTGSMAPYIRGGAPTENVAIALYDYRDFATLGEGDLILFWDASNRCVLHQLVKLYSDGWSTSGSANSAYDSGRVTRENYRGVVTRVFNIRL